MPRNHQLFIGRDHPNGDFARVGGDSRTITTVGLGVELDSEPGGRLTDTASHLGRVLADAGGKNQAIDPAQCRRHRSYLLGCAIHKIVHCQASSWVTASEQFAYIAADARDTEQTRLLVEDCFDFLSR